MTDKQACQRYAAELTAMARDVIATTATSCSATAHPDGHRESRRCTSTTTSTAFLLGLLAWTPSTPRTWPSTRA